MDFETFDGLIDSDEASKRVYHVNLALEKDYASQGRNLRKSELERSFNAHLPMGNKTAFTKGVSAGRKLNRGEAILKTTPRIRSVDLAKVIYYFYRYDASRNWDNLTKLVRGWEDEFSSLTQVEPDLSGITYDAAVESLMNLQKQPYEIINVLQSLVEWMQPIDEVVKKLVKGHKIKDQTIISQAQENELMRQETEATQKQLDELHELAQHEADPQMRKGMLRIIKTLRRKARDR